MITSFLLASSVITLMPGPSMILVIMNTIEGGIKNGLTSALGVVVADAILLALILLGIGAIITSSPLLFISIKWIGALYLIYLGIAVLRSLRANESSHSSSIATPFSSAVNMTLLNPKIIVFLIAFFPQFIDPLQPVHQQMLLLSALFLAVVMIILALFTLGAIYLRRLLQTSSGIYAMKIITGISLVGCGGLMIF